MKKESFVEILNNIDEDIIVSVINDDLVPLKAAVEELLNR